MAIATHIVRVGFLEIDALGNVVDKGSPTTPINTTHSSSHEHRVIADPAVPNSANNPTVEAYLALESADDFVVHHMDQTMIVTYERSTF
jgi:hypothetical protein